MPVLDKISNLGEGRKLKNLQDLARIVNTYEPEVEDLSDDELSARTPEFSSASTTASRWTISCPRRSPPCGRAPGGRSASDISTSS